jgi:GntR family transcriptional regulator
LTRTPYYCISTVCVGSMLLIHIAANSGVPIYLQIEQQIKQAIASGVLRTGEELPSTRRTAAELRINPNTVARAYTELEREGVIRTVPGGGTFVGDLSALAPRLLKAEKLRRLRPIARQLAIEAAQLRVSPAELHKLLDESIRSFEPGPGRGSLARLSDQEGDS